MLSGWDGKPRIFAGKIYHTIDPGIEELPPLER
jgi:hypothetical protein